ncbi:helix-turn-helix domain-containing protein [Vibrio sp. S4M6]|uniref:DNA-3-methyladenine glycosylase 2 family protein n=1 Tax=Vibrio sinus TaxID=2946865 RepID=UPI002029EC13|nr:Ada metal-binding domain-containing protein [Vibrio sinus]MCL9780155.1 helix-turn-helix domain-containing protein [Vibrio sinus]
MTLSNYSQLTDLQCQRARLARDARFDGVFFVAVKTTGIFCRPICPANLPKEENVEYFDTQAQALNAGYRPCLRCRPDSAPSSWAWRGVETTFIRALKMIEAGELHQSSVSEMSERLGISDRYLRLLFNKYLSMSPKQYALYLQLMFAKQLLSASNMGVTDIAFASGFKSVRRFNDAFIKQLKLTPSEIRSTHSLEKVSNVIDLTVHGEINWQFMLNFYRTRAIEGVEQINATSYQRTFKLNNCSGWFKAYPIQNKLRVEFELTDISQLRGLVSQIRKMFDVDTDIAQVENQLRLLSQPLIKYSGIRIPGVWNVWEAGVRAILGQQVSVKSAITQLNLLVSNTNRKSSGCLYFPTPREILAIDLGFLRMPESRKQTLRRFAEFYLNNPDSEVNDWLEIKGIGPWTTDYAKLRGLSLPNCFLETDLVVKKMLAKFPSLDRESVSPWGSYATFHCWSHQS